MTSLCRRWQKLVERFFYMNMTKTGWVCFSDSQTALAYLQVIVFRRSWSKIVNTTSEGGETRYNIALFRKTISLFLFRVEAHDYVFAKDNRMKIV